MDCAWLYVAPGSGDSWRWHRCRRACPIRERAEIAEGCYTLLLVMAGAEPMPEAGLRRLDQAVHCVPPRGHTTFGERHAWTRAGNASAAAQERHLADQLQPTAAFDHFLVGQDAYKRGDPIAALRHFDTAIQLERDQFWAHALSALCWLQLKGPVQAKYSLNTCVEREPEFAWLYILRGFASSTIPAPSPQEAVLVFQTAEADYDRARQILDRQPNDELRYILLVNRGVLRFQHGKIDQAATDLQTAIRLNDRSSQAYESLVIVFLKQGKSDEAVEQFGWAIEDKPEAHLRPCTAAEQTSISR